MVRLKTRYLLFDILYPTEAKYNSDIDQYSISLQRPSSSSIDARSLLKLIRSSIELNFGEWGAGMLAGTLAIKYFSQATSTGIIRVGRDHLRTLWGALSYISEIDDKPIIIRVIRVSGTIKKCEKAVIERNKRTIAGKRGKSLEIFESVEDNIEEIEQET